MVSFLKDEIILVLIVPSKTVIFVTSHSIPSAFSEVCINKKNQMQVFVGAEVREIPFLAEYVHELGRGIHARKHAPSVAMSLKRRTSSA